MKLIILFFMAMLATPALGLTSDEVDTIRFTFFKAIRSDKIGAATIVRLSFHDCVGGCDGCINLDNSSNAGLAEAIDIMESVYETVQADGIDISRADLWALCGRAAAEYGMEGMPGHKDYDSDSSVWRDVVRNFVSPFAIFKTGRVDCDTAPYTTDEHAFPGGTNNHDEIMTFFAENFGFSDSETVAILGAHTFGNLETENSGYSGPWTKDEATTFDNKYFQMMVDNTISYRSRELSDGTGDDARPIYGCVDESGENCGNMLVADLALAYDFSVDEDTRFANCDVIPSETTCTLSDSYDTIQAFAQDNEVWLAAYYAAYDKMTENGADALTEIV